MVQIRPLQQKAPSGFKIWRRVKVRIRRRRQLLKESFDDDGGRTFSDLESDDGESGDYPFDLQRTTSGRRAKPEIFGLSPCWGFAAGSGRWLRLACKKFLFRPDALISWTVNSREREREREAAQKVLIFSDCQDTSFSDRSWEQPEKERGKLKIASWVNGKGRWSLREHLFGDPEDGEDQQGLAAEKRKDDGRIGGEDGCYGCSGGRSWRSRSKSRKEGEELGSESDNSRKKKDENLVGASVDDNQAAALPDDIIEMCLARTPFASLMRARAVCKRWKSLTSSPHFLQMRDSIRSSDPWLFLFGLSRNGICLGQIQALDPASSRWHTINANILTGRVSFSVTAVNSEIYVVGGCSSSLRTAGSGSRSDNKESLRTLKSVLRYTPITGSWKKVCPLTTERASPIVGVFNMRKKKTSWSESNMRGKVDRNWASAPSSPGRRQQICERGSRRGGELAVYGGAEFRMRETSFVARTGNTIATTQKVLAQLKKCSSQDERCSYGVPEAAEFKKLDVQERRRTGAKEHQRTFGLIAVGGQGTWNEQLDSAEIYDPVTDRWREIASLPADHGNSCAGVVCKNFFYVYSESNRLAAYDLERDVWHSIRVSQDPARLLDYTPKLVSCRDRIFLLGVAWGMPSDGSGSEMATREIWELRQEPQSTGWVSVSQHPDAPLDWNAAFVADEERIFGVEMFKIFGQMLDFVTVCKISGSGGMAWERVSRIEMAMNGMDPSSCLTKTALVVRL